MSVMAAVVVRELGLMHLVAGLKAYKTASGAVTQALCRIEEVPIKVGGVLCKMTFMVVDTDSYDILLGLDLLIKIGAIVDVEQGLIQVRRGPGTDVEVLRLTLVNLLQRSGSVGGEHHDHCTQEQTVRISGVMKEAPYFHPQDEDERLSELDSSSDSGHSEESKEEDQTRGTDEGGSEFGNTELENLILKEGPQLILQLILQDKADDLLKEEITDEEDYADWIRWAAEEEQQMQNLSEAAIAAEESVLLQLQQMEVADSNGCVEERIMKNPKEETRWSEICQKIRIDQHLDKGMEQQLWSVLE
ncbi:unnamed protein product [Sphagnum troendelagicum]|uniref:Uncharacterized protein n=1 Tax=Sphagnum troendelagicum TaxID=128251 RepID=A0ABP0UG28_9BRYO